ncbi:MAG: fumarate hydratase C-terminal domain-containing protein [Clostridia bacterium]|nr:fumarate hydratase C-terminal domain-containing protein [Clostridia bacterium]
MREYDGKELCENAAELRAGDEILLSGTVYTARDAAHKRIKSMIESGEELPFDLKNSIIYYAGPTPAKPGQVCGSFGPTTSCRMDPFAPALYRLGMKATIGKGDRSDGVKKAIVETGGIYLIAIGGAGALAASHITECKEIAFCDLGCESVKKLTFNKFPLIVAIDSKGNDIYER